jgi:hypothetical protein
MGRKLLRRTSQIMLSAKLNFSDLPPHTLT